MADGGGWGRGFSFDEFVRGVKFTRLACVAIRELIFSKGRGGALDVHLVQSKGGRSQTKTMKEG